MPRHVDPEQRRQDVAHAVWRVIRRSGLSQASVRAVAREAGLSVGALRHYFSEQRGLQLYAFELINERMMRRFAAVDTNVPIRERVEAMMWALLPVTPEQVEEEQVRLAFLIESRTDQRLAAVVEDDRAEAVKLSRAAVVGLRDGGLAPADIDVEAATVELLALLDGLAQAAALNPRSMSGNRLQAAVRRWLDRLAPGPCQR